MKVFLICALLSLPALGQAPTASIVQLIANPEEYDGKVVIFEGVTNIEFEGNAVYLSKEHWRHYLSSFGIWLDVDPKLAKSRKWANGLYCILKGTFRADDRGHMGAYMGTLTDVTMFQVREAISPKEVEKKQKQAEQASAGQPATRSEPDSEGGDKPQPEPEGRSR